MQHIAKQDGHAFANADTCYGQEYGFNDKSLNGAIITINGRYPQSGYAMNEISAEIVYIISSSGSLHATSGAAAFAAGESILVPAGEKYYWDGNFTSYMVCAPAFDPAQHKLLED